MVRLNRITMQGFKSFSSRTTIPFPEGFNVVCGPNGSGKSNIIDALMFVLGTSSAKSIRAQRLENLIFNGGRNRTPADHCEVSLYLGNTDRKVPINEDEIKLTRKVSRSGVSIYKLNGKTVTRSKMIDLLTSANLSHEGFNIIMQGDVTKVIEMNPIERREVIDEISGISEFDEKKQKATSEMERVENRVRENMIVVVEKQRLVNRLKTEKENAEKYQKLNNVLRKAKASLVKKRKQEIENKLSGLDKSVDSDTKRFEELNKDFQAIEKDLEKKEKSLNSKSDEIIKKSRNYEVLKNIDKINTEIIRKKDKIEMNEIELKRLDSVSPTISDDVLKFGYKGVYGSVSSLVQIPDEYSTALDIAIGGHAKDIVVSNDGTASVCIKALKYKKLGRARFLPLNKIRGAERKKCDKEIIGYAIDLIKFEDQYKPVFQYVLGNTLVVKDIDIARDIPGFRVVTLDGDLIEKSGAMIGGYYRKIKKSGDLQKLKNENQGLRKEIAELEEKLKELKSKEEEETEDVKKLSEEKSSLEKEIEEHRNKKNLLYEERLVLQNSISRVKIEKARFEANIENINLELEDYKDVKEFFNLSIDELQKKVEDHVSQINELGPINMKALEEYSTLNVEFEELKKKLDKLLEEKEAIVRVVQEVEKKRYDKFMDTMNEISKNFSKIYKDLMHASGELRLEEENNIASGLIIEAAPEGKKILSLDSMSGGEKTLTSLAFLFAVMQHYKAPFFVFDEIDAALDKANTRKIVDLIKKYSGIHQFIVITHNDFTIGESDKVFGVSMEDGISKVFGIEMPSG